MFFRPVADVPIAVVILEIGISVDEEGTGATGRIEDSQFCDLLGALPLAELATVFLTM